MDERKEFLLHLFDKIWDDIGSTMKVIWQSIVVLLGAIATIMLTKSNVIPVITTYTIAIIGIIWILAHIENAAYWFNRNLVIIANIERQFLNENDSKNIHAYFTSHRPDNRMAPHFQLQYWFLASIAGCLLFYYTTVVFSPSLHADNKQDYWHYILPPVYAPYLITMVGIFFLRWFRKFNTNKYNEFKDFSPGKDVPKREEFKYGHGGENLS